MVVGQKHKILLKFCNSKNASRPFSLDTIVIICQKILNRHNYTIFELFQGTNMYKVLFLFIMLSNLAIKSNELTNFNDFKKACNQLPKYNFNQFNQFRTILTEKLFESELDAFFNIANKQFDKISWLGQKPLVNSNNFQAFVEKNILPTNSIIAIHGDIHGDIHSLNKFIEKFVGLGFLDKDNPFKIKNENFYILFLGDYVDRGWYGSEVIYAVLRLKNENPDNVFMVRGNHEDIDLNRRYGFEKEINSKFKFSYPTLLQKLQKFYNCLPVAIFLGSGIEDNYNFIQCCHGGIEIGFEPKCLLENDSFRIGKVIEQLMQKDSFAKVCCSKSNYFTNIFKNNFNITSGNGFMWNDFIVEPNAILKLSGRDGYRGTIFEFGQSITKKLLKLWSGKFHTIHSIFRAHQHSDNCMRERILNIDQLSHPNDMGIGKLWIQNSIHKDYAELLDDVPVVTFSVAPDCGYGWPIHSFGQLNMAENYCDWRLKALNTN